MSRAYNHGPVLGGLITDPRPIRALADMLSQYRGAKSRSSLDLATSDTEAASPTTVLPSSTELFYFYAQSLESCAKLSIGKGRMLWELARVQRRWLRTYAG
jgi:hypothetical protein